MNPENIYVQIHIAKTIWKPNGNEVQLLKILTHLPEKISVGKCEHTPSCMHRRMV